MAHQREGDEHHDKDHHSGHNIRNQLDLYVGTGDWLRKPEQVNGGGCRTDPGDDRQNLAHESAGEGEQS
jgi:hypothetical protein